MEVFVYIVVFAFFALVIGFQVWAMIGSSIAKAKLPLPARVLRAVNLALTLAALVIVIYNLVAG